MSETKTTTETLMIADFLLVQRALRQKQAGDAVLDFTARQISERYQLGPLDRMDLETGIITRITPDEADRAGEEVAHG